VLYLDFLRDLHGRLDPENYLEIGVRWGNSLGVSRCRSVGIDPAFAIDRELHTEVQLFRTTSDEYFARPDPLAPTGGEPFDLTFIDGMHLFEFALRDFINAERHSRHSSVIVFDDILPRRVVEANRVRRTKAWTGDIYSVIPVLQKYRPEVLMISVNTQPTGLLLVMGLDPGNTVLADNYDEIMAEFRRPDPQPVPRELLDRTFVQAPRRVLESPLLDVLSEGRRQRRAESLAREVREAAASSLGAAYAPAL
jgi:hypothetical protein